MAQHTARKLLKMLDKHGFYLYSIVGSHHHYKDGKGHYTTVPYKSLKDNIAPGTYTAILKQAGLK